MNAITLNEVITSIVSPKCQPLDGNRVTVGVPGKQWTYHETEHACVEPVKPYSPEMKKAVPDLLVELEMIAIAYFNKRREILAGTI